MRPTSQMRINQVKIHILGCVNTVGKSSNTVMIDDVTKKKHS